MANNENNPFAVPAGGGRVRRNVQDAEDAATGVGKAAPAPAASNTDPATGIKFYGGKVDTPEQKAKSGKALQDLLKKRADADSDDSDDKTA